MGQDKLKVLRYFNLKTILESTRAKMIRKLWNEFDNLYIALKNEYTDPTEFQSAAKAWLNYFLTP